MRGKHATARRENEDNIKMDLKKKGRKSKFYLIFLVPQ
jgi:hypothetical protein